MRLWRSATSSFPGPGGTRRELVIRVPDLEFLPGGAAALPDALARLLGRVTRFEAGPAAALAAALGLKQVPAAGPLTRLAQTQSPPDSAWLRFDPVSMLPDLTEVWLEKPVPLDFGDPALAPLVAELRQMLAAQGLEWLPEPGRGCGVVALQELPDVRFSPLIDIPGRRLAEVLPEGPEARRWRRLINESQMVFHQFRSQASGDQRGMGLWFWGAGRVPESPPPPALRILDSSDDVLLEGLARWLGTRVENAGTETGEISRDRRVLLNWPLTGPAPAESPAESLTELHETWIAPARGPVTVLGSHGGWRIQPRDRRAFWRRARPQGFVDGQGR